MTDLRIPSELLPEDGRFGAGPSKIHPDALAKLAKSSIMGTSHRKAPVKQLVANVKNMLSELYQAPEGYEVGLGVGGASLFWDAAVFSLIQDLSAHGVYGAFSKKFYTAAKKAPFLTEPVLVEVAPGKAAIPGFSPDFSQAENLDQLANVDVVAWAHNETSTGVAAPIKRPDCSALTVVDATSAAGGMAVDLTQTDVYYFSPQKNFASDGGLWISFFSPAAVERLEIVEESGRWIPDLLNINLALSNSRKDQTVNTPALATLALLGYQLEWILENGGLDFVTERTKASSGTIYRWAESSSYAQPFVTDEKLRSPVVCTIEFSPEIDLAKLQQTLTQNSIVDVSAYRGIGRNQLRLGCYTAIEPADAEKLTRCIDWAVEHLT